MQAASSGASSARARSNAASTHPRELLLKLTVACALRCALLLVLSQMEFVDTRTGEVFAGGFPQEILDMGEEAFKAAIAAQ